ncbi:MAG TPA: response regulator [Thiotrichales bacterium]|nr:response regulator [Thiotrichales bacterium]
MSQLEKVHVLVVDDSVTTRNSIARHLGDAYFILHASDGAEAWELVQSNASISLVFADLHMPVMNGMVLLKQIRDADDERISHLPVIMITGHEDSDAAKRASYSMGATDFISKPFSALDIISRAGSYTKLNQKISALAKTVSHDTLTGLYNRHGFQELGEKASAGAARYAYDLSVLTIQITEVEQILRKHGKKVAGQIISAVAKVLKKSLRKEEILAHLGSGRFAVLLPMTKAFRAHIVAMRFQKSVLNTAFKTGEVVIRTKLAAGLNSTENYIGKVDFNDLLEQAEVAVQASLSRPALSIVRHDEMLPKERSLASPEEVTTPGTTPAAVTGDNANAAVTPAPAAARQKIDAATFNRYMTAIFKGNFDHVPSAQLGNMVEPLEAFLLYANEQLAMKEA